MKNSTSKAFSAASWVALGIGLAGYLIGLSRSDMLLNEKGYYLTLLLFGLFAVVSLQKSVRDRMEDIVVSDIYYNICWVGMVSSIALLFIGLWNAQLLPSEKGFYAFAYLLALYAAVAVQKNTRDLEREKATPNPRRSFEMDEKLDADIVIE